MACVKCAERAVLDKARQKKVRALLEQVNKNVFLMEILQKKMDFL